MSRQEEKIIGRRLKTSYMTTVASITLVLFVLGLLGLLILFTQQLSDHVKENIGFTIFLHDNASLDEIIDLQKGLENQEAVKSTEYISREQAAEDLMNDLGEDFVEFLGYNPLSSSIMVKMNAAYANPDSLALFEASILKHKLVAEADYQKDLVQLVNENVRRIGIGILFFSILLTMIASALINNTIRLGVFSKRFIIKSMQLVGATQAFIRKPFLKNGLMQGFIASIISNILLLSTVYIMQQKAPALDLLGNYSLLLLLIVIVISLGLIISWISTYLAVRKYLNIKTDSLYYY
jgi:cell division transport system permease protein